MRHLPLLLVVVLLLTPSGPLLWAQQAGTPNRNYTINGNGSLASSYVTVNVPTNSTMANAYATLDANAPLLWAFATSGTIGWYLTATNSVDIGPVGLVFILDGVLNSNGSPVNMFARTDSSGGFLLSLTVPPSAAPSSAYFAMAHAAASSPDGMWVSQTHLVSFFQGANANCNPLAVNLNLSDDSFSQQALGFTFSFYGTGYNQCFVGSNGHITFQSGDSGWTGTPSFFLSAPQPRVDVWATDLNPSAGGAVYFYTNNLSLAEACWVTVPEYCCGGSNSFRAALDPAGIVTLYYGAMNSLVGAGSQSSDAIVGLSPGTNLAVGAPLNLSTPPANIATGTAPYEYFTTMTPNLNDLQSLQVTFLLDTQGNPFMLL